MTHDTSLPVSPSPAPTSPHPAPAPAATATTAAATATAGPDPSAVLAAQDSAHGDGFDYEAGSPHLRHPQLRTMIEARLRALVADTIAREGRCRVIEVGGGHGTFTRQLVEAGAEVTVTEASRASAELLQRTFADHPRVTVHYDETGEAALESEATYDLAVMIAVLHHIPDYLDHLRRLRTRITPGGSIFTVQDPLWYPRVGGLAHRADKACYLLWRVGQGNYARGLATRWRRLRGVYDDTLESDLVEYHVVRQGCDEEAIRTLLAEEFDVEVFSYWSTQSPLLQRALERTRLRSDFGIEARDRRPRVNTTA